MDFRKLEMNRYQHNMQRTSPAEALSEACGSHDPSWGGALGDLAHPPAGPFGYCGSGAAR